MGIRLIFTDPNTGEDGYTIHRDTVTMNPAALPAAIATIPADSTSYDDGIAADDVIYFYRVRAFIGAAEGVSDEISILNSTWTPNSMANIVSWYDPSDVGTLFQDTGATVPITADGQAVALMQDKSGNNFHAVQATLADRPIYKTDGNFLHWIEPQGARFFDVAGSEFSVEPFTTIAMVRSASTVSPPQRILDTRGTGLPGASRGWQMKTTTQNDESGLIDDGAGLYIQWGSGVSPEVTVPISTDTLYLMDYNNATATGRLFINDVDDVDAKATENADPGLATIISTAQSRLFAASDDDTVQAFTGRFYGGAIASTVLSESDRNLARAYFLPRGGVIA